MVLMDIGGQATIIHNDSATNDDTLVTNGNRPTSTNSNTATPNDDTPRKEKKSRVHVKPKK